MIGGMLSLFLSKGRSNAMKPHFHCTRLATECKCVSSRESSATANYLVACMPKKCVLQSSPA